MREIVLDTETTGLNHMSGDRIIEIGCVELINHVATNNTLQFYCRVDKKISEEATKITGITNEFLEKEKTFEEQYEKLITFIKNDPLNRVGRVGLNYSNLIRGLLTEHASNETKDLTEEAREMFHDHPDTYRNNTVHCNHFFLSHLG